MRDRWIPRRTHGPLDEHLHCQLYGGLPKQFDQVGLGVNGSHDMTISLIYVLVAIDSSWTIFNDICAMR